MKITDITLGMVAIPLKTPFVTALRHVETAQDLIVQIHTDDGHTGWGSAPATVVITGDSHQSEAEAILHILAPQLIGRDVEDRQGLVDTIQSALVHNTSAKAAVDIAIHDLFCQHYGLPLYRLFGGAADRIMSDLTISINDIPTMVEDARKAVARGYRRLKLKVGHDPALDVQRIAAIREAVGPEIAICVDANQSWHAKNAIRAITAMEDAGLAISFVEQPVPSWDFDGLKLVTDHVDTDIMADEAAFGTHDVFRLLSMHACDLINIKLMKAGGLAPAYAIASMAKACGVGTMMGCMLESKVGITAAAALAAGCGSMAWNDLDAADLMAADPVAGGITYDKDEIVVPEVPGLGITDVAGLRPFP